MQTLNKMKEKLEKETGEHRLVKQQVAELSTRLHDLSTVNRSHLISSFQSNLLYLLHPQCKQFSYSFYYLGHLELMWIYLLSKEAGSYCTRWSPSRPRTPRWSSPPTSSSTPRRNDAASSTTSSLWCHDAPTATSSTWWPSTSPWTPSWWPTASSRSPCRPSSQEEEYSPAIKSTEVLQLVQVVWGEVAWAIWPGWFSNILQPGTSLTVK